MPDSSSKRGSPRQPSSRPLFRRDCRFLRWNADIPASPSQSLLKRGRDEVLGIRFSSWNPAFQLSLCHLRVTCVSLACHLRVTCASRNLPCHKCVCVCVTTVTRSHVMALLRVTCASVCRKNDTLQKQCRVIACHYTPCACHLRFTCVSLSCRLLVLHVACTPLACHHVSHPNAFHKRPQNSQRLTGMTGRG